MQPNQPDYDPNQPVTPVPTPTQPQAEPPYDTSPQAYTTPVAPVQSPLEPTVEPVPSFGEPVTPVAPADNTFGVVSEVPAAPAAVEPTTQNPLAPAPVAATEKSNKTVIIILGAIAAVLVIGAGIYLAVTLL